ncbi:TonB family protein [Desulfobotulus alkaliphilus]|uniref:TonB family protein n=1 Tax=Desulfobotulus alkaliphilus TaxID=622671 RepID=A0A562RTN4_9BACT|nr:energy transducer TonB [Desulfobotulus alkaliphilus]TWI71690.1 TonB family protein [Desulfobotulus alkaliphilus]
MRSFAVWLVCWGLGAGLTLLIFGLFLVSGENSPPEEPWEGVPVTLSQDLIRQRSDAVAQRPVEIPELPEWESLEPLAFDAPGLRIPETASLSQENLLPEVVPDVRPPDAAALARSLETLLPQQIVDADAVYGPGELDTLPRPLHRVIPVFPHAARRQGIRHGRVRLLMEVDREGRVRDVQVISADPSGYFEAVSLDAARRWRFTPGRLGGADVITRFELPLVFGEPDG